MRPVPLITAFALGLALASATPIAAAEPDTIGGFDPTTGQWHLRSSDGFSTSFYFGDPGDAPLVGDWDCDGVDTPGLFRRTDGFAYLRNSNTQGSADIRFYVGDPGDEAVSGDFDGDGCDTLSVYRPAEQRFYIVNSLGSDSGGPGPAETSFVFGNPGDSPFVGDFDGDGVDDAGLYREANGFFYGRFSPTTGPADFDYFYGNPRDRAMAGDWTGNGTDTAAIFRPSRGRYMLRYANVPGPTDEVIPFGDSDWLPVAGRFALGSGGTGRGTLVVSGTGDVNLDTRVIPALSANGHDYAWSGLEGLFGADDLSIINLECAPSNLGAAVPKAFNFRCDLGGVNALARNGVEVANLANNHSQDYGAAAMLDGAANVRSAGVAPVGVGADINEALEPAILEINGWTVAVLGFGGVYHTSAWLASPTAAGMANGDDAAQMAAAVRSAKERADLVFVTVHWGTERTFSPDPGDIDRARAMIDAGADAIFGHHSHRLQPLDFYKGKPIFWSLGNFVWPKHDTASATTGVAEVVIQPDGLVNARIIPAFIAAPGHPVLVD